MSRTVIILPSVLLVTLIAGAYFFLSRKQDETVRVFERERMEAPVENDTTEEPGVRPVEEEPAPAFAPFGTVSVAPDITLGKKGSGFYFKAGAYTQSNCSKESDCSADNYGEVVIHDLAVRH